jgi:hypothetical protein
MQDRKQPQTKGSKATTAAKGAVPSVPEKVGEVVGLFVADMHFSDTPPIARSCEKDWIQVQEEYVEQLWKIQRNYQVPIFIAGDIFNKWNSSPYLISAVISWLKGPNNIYAIPGNHDTPNHNPKELHRSAYWTLLEAGVIINLEEIVGHEIGKLAIGAFPFGSEVIPCSPADGLALEVAIIHSYIWTEKTGHMGASQESRYGSWSEKLRGYDVAIFGDNHKPFTVKAKIGVVMPLVYNCGTFMRRHSDEKDIRPSVGLLYSDGEMRREYLDTSKDQFIDPKEEIATLEKTLEMDLTKFADELSRLSSDHVDFSKAVRMWAKKNKVAPEVEQLMLKCLGGES